MTNLPQNFASWIWTLPKTDLHLHLDTSLRPETAVELARPRGIQLLQGTDLIAPEMCHDLMDYIKYIDVALKILQDTEALQRCAQDLAENLINDGVVYAEIRFAPELHTKKGLKERQIIESVWQGLGQGNYKGLRTRLIVCALRHAPAENALKAAQVAADNQDQGVIALDCAGDESGLNYNILKKAYDYARDAGLHTIAHAGEACGPESVWGALDILKAERIGHGVRSIEDPSLVQRLAREQIPLENCPTSNIQTRAVNSWAEHPAGRLLTAGVRVTINCDGRTTTNTTVTDEYVKIARALELGQKEILVFMANGFKSGFDVGPLKDHWLRQLNPS